MSTGLLERLARFATSPFFPFLIGCVSAFNIFVVLLSGPTTVLFVGGCLARPTIGGSFRMAFVNALGTAVGSSVFVWALMGRGLETVETAFPQIFDGQTWESTRGYVERHGLPGAVACAAMPVTLHPLILFALLAKMDPARLILCILMGRTLKYCAMAACAHAAPQLLSTVFRVDLSAVKRQLSGEKGSSSASKKTR